MEATKPTFEVIEADRVPFLTTEQMVEVDRAMIEDYGILLIQMMENAGRHLADVARHVFLKGDPAGQEVVVLAGPGGNGGGALTCARRLSTWGANVRVHLAAASDALREVPAHQLHIVESMGVHVAGAVALSENTRPSLIIDGVIGYSLRGDPRDGAAALIDWANECDSPVLSLDVPSGVDSTTGRVAAPAIDATATMTLALPKVGLRAPSVRARLGTLFLADISVPPSLYRSPKLDLSVPALFSRSEIVQIAF